MSRWKTTAILARGEASTTIRLEDRLTGQTCIEKWTSQHNPAALAQARREADLLLQLKGSHAPLCLECREDQDHFVVRLEDLQGHVPKSRKEKKAAIRMLTRHLKTIHQMGYVYLDLKPEHLFMTAKGPVLLDYNGVVPDGTTRCLFATPGRLPPDKTFTPQSDIYVLGLLCRDWMLHPWWRWQATLHNPKRRPDLESLRPGNLPLILLLFLSVFALAFVPMEAQNEEMSPSVQLEQAILESREVEDSSLLKACSADPACAPLLDIYDYQKGIRK